MEPDYEFGDFGDGENSFANQSDFMTNEPQLFESLKDIETSMEQMRSELQTRANWWIADVFKELPQVINQGPPRVTVGVGKAGKLFSAVECIICKKTVRLCFMRSTSGGPVHWVFKRGNFTKHLQRNHKEFLETKQ